MLYALILIPVLTALASFLLYKQVGKREFLKLDAVQFIYAFILSPLAFIWMKSFLLFFAQNEINPNLSQNELFAIDTVFSVGFLFFYAFVVIHSLTKSFEIRQYQDPLYDILTHVESFHLWISHTFMYTLGFFLLTVLSVVNVFAPVAVELAKPAFYAILAVGFLSGLLGFAAIYLSAFKEKFLKLMKLVFAVFFVVHVLVYFFFDPKFRPEFVAYWSVFAIFSALVFASFFIERSRRGMRFIERFHHKEGWAKGNFLTLLEK